MTDLKSQKFVHLRLHSEYSMVDGVCRINPTVDRISNLEMPAVAMTDHMNLCGLIKFYKKCRGSQVKPIAGVDLVVNDETGEHDNFRVSILCMNQQGYMNAKILITKAYQENQKRGIPVIDKNWFRELNEGLIVLSGGKDGDVGKAMLSGNHAIAAECFGFLAVLFS